VDGADELEQDSQGRSHGLRDQTDR
jgi:hypothetical protein